MKDSVKSEICVDIVVPVLNRETMVTETLDSIVAQTHRPIHLIIVDNASTDNTPSVIKRWREENVSDSFRVTILDESKTGASHARNRGMKYSDSELVMFFDSDDIMHSDLVEKSVTCFNSSPNLDLVCWKERIIFPSGNSRSSHISVRDAVRCHLVHAMISTDCFLAKRRFLEKTGGWNECLQVWDDYELGFRMLLRNPSIKVLDKTLVAARVHSDSITGRGFSERIGEWERVIDIMESGLSEADVSVFGGEGWKRRIGLILDYRRVALAASYRREGKRCDGDKLYRMTTSKHAPAARFLLSLAFYLTRRGFRGAHNLFI